MASSADAVPGLDHENVESCLDEEPRRAAARSTRSNDHCVDYASRGQVQIPSMVAATAATAPRKGLFVMCPDQRMGELGLVC